MKLFISIAFLMIFFAVEGCKKDNPVSTTPKDTTINPPPDSNTIYYVVNELGMRNLRIGEHYQMWLKIAPDMTWKSMKRLEITYTSPEDTAVMVGSISSSKALDSIQGILISIEQTSASTIPAFPLLEAHDFIFDHKKRLVASLDHSQIFGDYSGLEGSLVFTSKSFDSLAYTHEFYLMNFAAGLQTPALLSLNTPPAGWKYGLWAIDTFFTPHEFFFYGLFSSAIGHDNDSANDFYPYPGGWKPQQMNMPSGSIIVTLEPQLYGDSLKYKSPSPFTLLNFNRVRFIDKNKNYSMTNISASGLPSGTITFRKN